MDKRNTMPAEWENRCRGMKNRVDALKGRIRELSSEAHAIAGDWEKMHAEADGQEWYACGFEDEMVVACDITNLLDDAAAQEA